MNFYDTVHVHLRYNRVLVLLRVSLKPFRLSNYVRNILLKNTRSKLTRLPPYLNCVGQVEIEQKKIRFIENEDL